MRDIDWIPAYTGISAKRWKPCFQVQLLRHLNIIIDIGFNKKNGNGNAAKMAINWLGFLWSLIMLIFDAVKSCSRGLNDSINLRSLPMLFSQADENGLGREGSKTGNTMILRSQSFLGYIYIYIYYKNISASFKCFGYRKSPWIPSTCPNLKPSCSPFSPAIPQENKKNPAVMFSFFFNYLLMAKI